MSTQPEALRLANALEDATPRTAEYHEDIDTRAATELRRLHAANQELLEALKVLEPYLDRLVCYASTAAEYPPNKAVMQASAAIANHKGAA
jgi:mevalonate kinase